ncbi:MAG: NINE protein [Fimbriimonadales bacterium]
MNVDPSAYKVCPNCRTTNYLRAPVCTGCGHVFQTQFAPPPNQTQAFYNPPGANPNLDPYQYAYPYDRPDSNKLLITILLWFFLGHLGAHRFFLGHTNTAIVMLILQLVGDVTICFFGLGLILILAVEVWWIIDLIQMLTGNLRPTDGTRIV